MTRAGGCSNHTGAQLQAAIALSRRLGLHRFEAIQLPYNLLQSDHDAFPVVQREQIGVMAYSPLAAGFLADKYTPDRTAIPKGTRFDVIPGHVDIYFNDRNFRRVKRLHELAARIGVPPLQLALAWVLQNPLVTSVLIGVRSQAHLENALAAERLAFDPSWLAEIQSWDTPAGQ
jgi:aryl-alcohol dehydrogenase-like predicted oxidoreductase